MRAFARYLAVDKQVIEASPVYNDLPQDLKVRKSRSRKAPTVFSTTTSDDSPRKKRFVVTLDTSSDEDNSSQSEDDGGDEE